jgi:CheY-like chemotaxis protein
MSDDLISIRIAIVSEAPSERELVRQAATQASIPVDVSEIDATTDAVGMSKSLVQGAYDVVFFDSRIAKSSRQMLLDALRQAPSRPLAIFIGAAEIKTRGVLTDGLDVDGTLAKPIDVVEARDLIQHCIKARLPKRVLIVDDSSIVRSVIRKVLGASRFKLQAEEAEDGAVAINLAKKQRYDIVFLDCQMPVIDGFAAIAEFHRIQPDMQVVMITGTRDIRIEDRARAEGAKDFLYKPFFANDIDAVLNRLFGLMRPRWN